MVTFCVTTASTYFVFPPFGSLLTAHGGSFNITVVPDPGVPVQFDRKAAPGMPFSTMAVCTADCIAGHPGVVEHTRISRPPASAAASAADCIWLFTNRTCPTSTANPTNPSRTTMHSAVITSTWPVCSAANVRSFFKRLSQRERSSRDHQPVRRWPQSSLPAVPRRS